MCRMESTIIFFKALESAVNSYVTLGLRESLSIASSTQI